MKKVINLFTVLSMGLQLCFLLLAVNNVYAGGLPNTANSKFLKNPHSHQSNFVKDEILVKFNDQTSADIISRTPYSPQLSTLTLSANKISKGSTLSKLTQDIGIVSIEPVFKGFHEKIQNEIIKGASISSALSQVNKNAAKSAVRPNSFQDLTPYYKIKLSPKSNLHQAIDKLNSMKEVVFAEPNYLNQAVFTPNDPYFNLQWAHEKLQSQNAWNIEKGNPNTIIAILDSGVDYNHPDLAANMWQNLNEVPGDNVDNDFNGFADDIYGWDFMNNDSNPMDDNSHGTHCAGIAAGKGNNGLDISGVCPDCSIMALKFLGADGSGDTNNASNAFYYAAENGAKIISNSWGSYEFSNTLQTAIDYAYAYGSIIIAAAGNDDENTKFYPAAYEHVISVAATDSVDQRSIWTVSQPPYPGQASNFGYWIDLAAPGTSILSTIPNNTTAYYSGTSMATPHVAGLAGLVLSQHPTFTNEQLERAMLSTTDSVQSEEYIGSGRINSFKALQMTNVPTAKISSIARNDIINGVVNIQGTANGVNFNHYKLEYGQGNYPSSWVPFQEAFNPVVNNSLAQFDTTSLIGGRYSIRLTVADNSGNESKDVITVLIDNSLHQGWPFKLSEGVYFTSPVTGDIDNDGKIETVMVTLRGNLTVVNSDGTLKWSRKFPAEQIAWVSPTLVDLNNDGKKEIIFASQFNWPGVYLINYDGTDYPGWPKDISKVMINTPVVADIDNDGKPEIIASTKYDNINNDTVNVYIWRADGSDFPGWPIVIKTNQPSVEGTSLVPAVGDLDGDGYLDIVVGFSNGEVYAWNYKGKKLSGWPFDADDNSGYTQTERIAIGDVNNDGTPEVVGTSGGGTINIWTSKGKLLPGFPLHFNYALSEPALGDIDGDGNLELVVHSNDDHVYAFKYTGQILDGWPVPVKQDVGNPPWSSVVLGDVDGDGKVDVVAAGDEARIYALHGDGTLINGWPKTTADSVYSSPVIGDFDKDGKVEVLLSDYNRLYMWDTSATFDEKNNPWPMLFRDAQRTSNYNLVQNPPNQPVLFQGALLDEETNLPIKGARLTIRGSRYSDNKVITYQVITDQKGEFKVYSLEKPRRAYYLFLKVQNGTKRYNLVTRKLTSVTSSQKIYAKARITGPQKESVTGDASLSGFVLTNAQDPNSGLPDIKVTLREKAGLRTILNIETGEDGYFRFDNLMPGNYDLSAFPRTNFTSAKELPLQGDLEINIIKIQR